ncbi:hypothetical protein Trydic_g5654 [Trypoxylus dichotomus]
MRRQVLSESSLSSLPSELDDKETYQLTLINNLSSFRECMVRIHLILPYAFPCASNQTTIWLQKYNWDGIVHQPHSPDLVLPDYHLFGLLKAHLSGKRFEDDDELQDGNVRDVLEDDPRPDYPTNTYPEDLVKNAREVDACDVNSTLPSPPTLSVPHNNNHQPPFHKYDHFTLHSRNAASHPSNNIAVLASTEQRKGWGGVNGPGYEETDDVVSLGRLRIIIAMMMMMIMGMIHHREGDRNAFRHLPALFLAPTPLYHSPASHAVMSIH